MTKRNAYYQELADENGVSLGEVLMLADLLGPSEDYDGLVTSLEDYAAEQEQ